MTNALYDANRKAIQATLGDSILLAFAAPESTRNNDVTHPYRQDSDFYYLTGIEEPQCALALTRDKVTVFARQRDPGRETWDGPRVGVEGAQNLVGAQQAYDFKELATELPGLLRGHNKVYYSLASTPATDELVLGAVKRARQLVRRGGTAPTEVCDSGVLLHEQRRVKSEGELTRMRQAAAIAVEAHLEAMRAARPGMYEYELQAIIEHRFLRAGARRPAYETIVGGGMNATILHYIRNDKPLGGDDLVLIDAGCEYDYYAADITRTFPVSGRFTPAQQAIYEVVLAAQHAAFAEARAGVSQRALHDVAVKVLTQGLLDLKILEGDLETAIGEGKYKQFYMHSTGHLLGMDVHDVGREFDGETPRPLASGCVITLEPGLYFGQHTEVAERYRGIGVRIEDDIAIQAEGFENLTAALPTAVSEVEAACRS